MSDPDANGADVEHVEAGISGHVGAYDVIISGDEVRIIEDVRDPKIVERTVDDLGEFIQEAEAFRLGWAEFPDFEVIYCYDKADNCFGYAVNLTSSLMSEWGYAPFRG